MELSQAKQIADELRTALAPACLPGRCCVAGSVRRGKEQVHDIEIICAPDLARRPRLVMGLPPFKTLLDVTLYGLEQSGRIIKRVKNGERYKQLALREGQNLDGGFNLDLFIILPPASFGYQLVIRTGPAEFSHWLVTPRAQGGALPSGLRVADAQVWDARGGTQKSIEIGTEEQFFQALGLEWISPSSRQARWNELPDIDYAPVVVAGQVAQPAITNPAPQSSASNAELPPLDPAILDDFARLGSGVRITGRELKV